MKQLFARTGSLQACLVCLLAAAGAQTPTASTAEDLIKHVLTALETKDQAALEKLTITEAEYKKYVWPNVATRVAAAKMDADRLYDLLSKIQCNWNYNEFG